ncbi:MAG TPA: hypothetical protein PK016_07495 [Candidatus Atribacteria bacterium]|nr:hypothetical protein [Candidatus Atribacteria bacterium]
MRKIVRVLTDSPLSGYENMSRDEALLEIGSSNALLTLRFFEWREKTLSVGRFQKTREIDFDYLKTKNLPLVRRPTGGRAILHDKEVTFSLFIPASPFKRHTFYYEELQKVLTRMIGKMGIKVDEKVESGFYTSSPSCFSIHVSHEIMVRGKKIIGVAQARGEKGNLFQASFILEGDREKIASCFKEKEKVQKELENKFLPLNEILSSLPEKKEIYRLLLESLEEEWGVEIEEGEWSAEELQKAEELFCTKYYPDSLYHTER